MNTTTYKPKVKFRVLATDWEAEIYIECWTEKYEDAQSIALALMSPGKSVQVDEVKTEQNNL